MTFLLTFCLMMPGVCQTTGLDQIEAVVALHDDVGPVERWRPIVADHFPQAEVDTAMCIIRHESNGDPAADNPRSSARGLFQVLSSLWAPHYGIDRVDLYEPITNIRIAKGIWEEQGWWAWSPYKRGACR